MSSLYGCSQVYTGPLCNVAVWQQLNLSSVPLPYTYYPFTNNALDVMNNTAFHANISQPLNLTLGGVLGSFNVSFYNTSTTVTLQLLSIPLPVNLTAGGVTFSFWLYYLNTSTNVPVVKLSSVGYNTPGEYEFLASSSTSFLEVTNQTGNAYDQYGSIVYVEVPVHFIITTNAISPTIFQACIYDARYFGTPVHLGTTLTSCYNYTFNNGPLVLSEIVLWAPPNAVLWDFTLWNTTLSATQINSMYSTL